MTANTPKRIRLYEKDVSPTITTSKATAVVLGATPDEQRQIIEASHLVISYDYVSDTLTDLDIIVDMVEDGIDFQEPTESTASGITTEHQRIRRIGTTRKSYIVVQLTHPTVRVSLQGIGVVGAASVSLKSTLLFK